MSDWWSSPKPTAPDVELVRPPVEAPLRTVSDVVRVLAIGGPDEAAVAGGIARGSIGYHTERNGFPAPIRQLRGVRLWDLDAVAAWKMARR